MIETISNTKAAELLESAIRHLEKGGWTRFSHYANGAVCINGAIGLALGDKVKWYKSAPESSFANNSFMYDCNLKNTKVVITDILRDNGYYLPLYLNLLSSIRSIHPNHAAICWSALYSFNDCSQTTKEQVLDVLTKSAKYFRELG